MAASTSQRGGIIEGINVTPLVDIVLVLLLIFIVTAKMVVAPAVPLDLPKASQSEEVQSIFSVAIPAEGPMLVDGKAVDDSGLSALAQSALGRDAELRAVIHADGAVPHRRVIEVLDAIKRAGVSRIAFAVVKPEPMPAEPGKAEPNEAEPPAAVTR
ncbi:MAG TPA: biopolymer transporter ExbD [Terriglobales bacterium]|nr:biopolymer transporter ExbD [Terriglobales bacterium]